MMNFMRHKGDMVLVMGDFKAKIGAGEGDRYIGRYGLGSRNESKDRLHEKVRKDGISHRKLR